jgi:hypothetical protein
MHGHQRDVGSLLIYRQPTELCGDQAPDLPFVELGASRYAEQERRTGCSGGASECRGQQ